MQYAKGFWRINVISVDTNAIVRLLTRDDDIQHTLAVRVFETSEVFITDTVLLETEWVLRYAYGFERAAICQAFTDLLGLRNISVSDPHSVMRAIESHGDRLGFYDALHLSLSESDSHFMTFDKRLVKQAEGRPV